MTVRAVEGKKPYTGGVAIEVTEDREINLRLRDENNLIIWDEEDNEIYVDLQLGDEITPTDDFPVGITTGRAIVDNGWDATGTLVCFKTTSGDNIKLFYTDSGSVFVDNGTGTFKQIYLKSEVDALLATKQNLLTAGDNITIDSNNVISADKGIVVSNTQPSDATEGLLWYNTVTDQLKVYDGTDWNGIGGGGGGSTYTAGHGINIDSNDEISNTLPFEPTNTGTAGQVLKLDSNGDYGWDNESGGGSGDVSVSTDTGNELTTGAKLWIGLESDFSSITTPDSNTMYIQYVTDGGGGWQPGVDNIVYFPLINNLTDYTGNYTLTASGASITTVDGVKCLDCRSGCASAVISTLPQGTAERTNMFWFRVTTSNYGCPYSYGSTGYTNYDSVYRDSFSGLAWQSYGYGVGSNYNPNVGEWCHVALTKTSGDSEVIYINGIQKATGSITFNTNGTTLYIGADNVNASILQGYMSNFIIESKARTAQEVADYYNQTKGDYGIS